MPHLRCAFRRSRFPPFPTDSPSTMPPLLRLGRPFTVCPHSRLPASLHELRSSCASLSHRLRRLACKAKPVSPMPLGQSRLFPCRTPSQTVVCQPLRGHMCASVTATRHEVPRFTPTPSVHTASSRKHVCICECQRTNPRITACAALAEASGVLAVVHAAFRRTEHQLRKNANRPRNPRRHAKTPLRGEKFSPAFFARNHWRNSPKTGAHYAQGVSTHARTHAGADGERTRWRVMHAHEGRKPRRVKPPRHARPALRQAVKPSQAASSRRPCVTPRALCASHSAARHA